MLKPLLRTIPTLSGNIKIACELTDFQKIDEQTSQAYVRHAKMLPISSNVSQKKLDISLLNSSYEFDIKRFFEYYNDIFFDDCFDFNKEDYTRINKYNTIKQRNTDFEFGCKRVSYQKNGTQFAFYAPIYIESYEDIPDYFLINIVLKNEFYEGERTIRINITSNSDYKYNYLFPYLNRYAEKIDNNVVYCMPNSGQAVYHGINLVNGGFSRIIDNVIDKIYTKQMTINNFDTTITTGWKRNKICMKQIIPLCFYFNINDILSDSDKLKYADAKASISGAYYKCGEEVKFYDIDTDYTLLTQDHVQFNVNNGIMDHVSSKKNILDTEWPALNEMEFIKYKFSNKVSPMYNRWKLKYSTDKNPYITNMSPAFSINQNSQYKYGEFPENYESITVIADDDNNIILPLSNAIVAENSPYYHDWGILNSYKTIMNKYVSTWFETVPGVDEYVKIYVNNPVDIVTGVAYYHWNDDEREYVRYTDEELEDIKYRLTLPKGNPKHISVIEMYRHDVIWTNSEWANVSDSKAYYKGILYDLSNIYKSVANIPHIDKFGVFVRLNFTPLETSVLKEIKSAKYSIFTSKKYTKNRNCFVSQTVPFNFASGDFDKGVTSFFINEGTAVKNELNYKSLFVEAKNTDGDFIDLMNYGFDYYNVNKYYKLSEIEEQEFVDPITGLIIDFEKLLKSTLNYSEYTIDGYELLPIYRLSEVFNDNKELIFEKQKYGNGEWVVNKLYFSHNGNFYKNQYDAKSIESMYKEYGDTEFAVPLYIKDTFISYSSLKNIFYEKYTNTVADTHLLNKLNELTEYEFCPVVEYRDRPIAQNVFVRRDTFTGRTYGDAIPTAQIEQDKDLIYVDPYNINKVIENYNNRFGKNIPLYDVEGGEELTDLNSYEFFAKFLNDIHLRWYFNTLYENLNITEDPTFPLRSIYVKKRLIINNYLTENIFVKDEYTPLSDFYIVNVSKLIKDSYDGKSINTSYVVWKENTKTQKFKYETNLKNVVNKELYETIIKSDEVYYITINDIYSDNLKEILVGVVTDPEYREEYYRNIYYMASSDILVDLIYDNEGWWYFSDNFNTLQNVDEIVGIPELNTDDLERGITKEETSNFKFELVYRKRFIKVNENIYNMINVEGKINLPYKDLYLYVIEEPEAYPKNLQFYYTDNVNKFDSTFETTACLTPLFNDVYLQDKTNTSVYIEYNKNNISPATYLYSQTQIGKYYRYDANNVNVMYDISEYPEEGFPIIGHDVHTGETTYYYTYSYVSSYYSKTGYNLISDEQPQNKYLTTYNILKNCNSYVTAASSYVADKTYVVTYSYTDYRNPQKGTNVVETRYDEYTFNKIYPENKRTYITYRKENNEYVITNSSTYVYYPKYEEGTYQYNNIYTFYDDLGIYDTFKLNSYITTYTYTYAYTTNQEVTVLMSDPKGRWASYELTYITQVDSIGYGTGYVTYGFYFIDAFLDNTASSFNVVDKQYRQKKYFSYINKNYIYRDNYSLTDMFGMVLPFTQLQLLRTFNTNNKLIIKPSIYTTNTHYKQVPLYDNFGEQYAYDIILNSKSLGQVSLERYLDNIVPYIKETTVIRNAYNIKYKEVDAAMNVTYKGSPIYPTDLGIYQYSPVRIYKNTTSYNLYTPVEYKYFNDNLLINLSEEIEIHVSDSLTYKELLEMEEDQVVLNAFKNYIRNGKKNSFTDDEILFLYNRYNVNYDSVCVGLNIDRTEKIYTLTYKFKLL